ncbi:hypothetical protein J6590_095136 [Homalodisca vitripennis]|nr:hypothetical protein J6590_095136 [Homalodisca vitripennis]
MCDLVLHNIAQKEGNEENVDNYRKTKKLKVHHQENVDSQCSVQQSSSLNYQDLDQTFTVEMELSDIGLAINNGVINESVPAVDLHNMENMEDVNTVSNTVFDSALLLNDNEIDTHKDALENLSNSDDIINLSDINIDNLSDEAMLESIDEIEYSLENEDVTGKVLTEIPVPVESNEVVEELQDNMVSDDDSEPSKNKGRPQKGRKQKHPGQSRNIRKGRTLISVIFQLKEKKLKKNNLRNIFVFAKISAMKRLM